MGKVFRISYGLSRVRCSIRTGNLLKTKGDILLCPVSREFVFSNPLARTLLRKGGGNLAAWLKKSNSTPNGSWKSAEFLFLPHRALQYRGVVYVPLDFYSEDRGPKNSTQLARLVPQLEQLNCCKLTVPNDPIYGGFGRDKYWWNLEIWDAIAAKCERLPTFPIEIVLRPERPLYRFYGASHAAFEERRPHADTISLWPQPGLPKRHLAPDYQFDALLRWRIRRCLTLPGTTPVEVRRLCSDLKTRLGEEDETGPGRGTPGWKSTIRDLLKELPWNAALFEGYLVH